MAKIMQIIKIIGKYAWLLPVVKKIIVEIADGIKKAKADGEVTGKEVAWIMFKVVKEVAGIFDVQDGIDESLLGVIEKGMEGKKIKFEIKKK